MDLTNLIAKQILILVPALWIIGAVVKSTPKVPNWIIPWILIVLGIVGGMVMVGASVDGLLQGILAAGLAVFGHQIGKNTIQGMRCGKQNTDPPEDGN